VPLLFKQNLVVDDKFDTYQDIHQHDEFFSQINQEDVSSNHLPKPQETSSPSFPINNLEIHVLEIFESIDSTQFQDERIEMEGNVLFF
jgi:hypothetical protein